MFLKILVTLVLVVVAWTAAVRLTGPGRPRRRLRRRPGERPREKPGDRNVPAAQKCAACGIYLPPGETCRCTDKA